MAGVTIDQIKELYEKQVGAGAAELAIVGDFDPETTLAAVREILKDWKSDVAYKRIERKAPTDVAGFKDNINTPDKKNAQFVAGITFPMKESDPDYAALRLGNFLFGGGTLSSRLGNRIRQKEGLSYGVTSSFAASQRDPVATFTVTAITNPANIDKVEVAFLDELNKFLAEGPTAKELAEAKQGFLEALKVSRTADAGIASQIISNIDLGRTFAHESEQEQRIREVSPDDVKAAFRKYIDPKKLVIIRAGDFKKD
jgi:zinc protease